MCGISNAFFAAVSTLALLACADQSAVPKGDPRYNREAGLKGFTYPEDVLAEAGGRLGWAQGAIADYARVAPDDVPARIEPLDTTSCVVARPAAGDLVRHVFVERGVGEASLYQIHDADLSGRASAVRDQLRVVNVVVTEKSAPVHLVLSSETSVIWNILPAAGVAIANIAAVSADGVGLAGAAPTVAVQAYYGEALTRCDVAPVRQPQDDWAFTRNAMKAGGAQRQSLDALRADADAYEAWLTKWFGAAAVTGAIAHQGIGAVLIGPTPASAQARVAMRPLAGSTLKLSLSDHVIVGRKRDYEEALARLSGAATAGGAGT